MDDGRSVVDPIVVIWLNCSRGGGGPWEGGGLTINRNRIKESSPDQLTYLLRTTDFILQTHPIGPSKPLSSFTKLNGVTDR